MSSYDDRKILDKTEAGQIIDAARIRAGKTWTELANAINRPVVWTTSALLGSHPVTAEDSATIGELLQLDADVIESLQAQPYRTADPVAATDPTIYRLQEAVSVYGPAIKALIHEEFGDGIMSAINFKVDVDRRADPDGDRVVITLDGKFLDYRW